MDRDFSIELVRVTEEAALAAARWTGKGNKEKADEAATEGMRTVFNTIPIQGTVVIGEGEMDEAPMLYIGEKLGTGYGPHVDIAVDPLEGTNIVANGTSNAIAVVAVANHGNLLHAPDMYMEKIAVGPAAAGKIDINAPVIENLKAVAKAKNKDIADLVVAILNRERHKKIIQEIRDSGARVKLIQDGEVATVVTTGFESTGVDMIMGSGGAPEGVLAAVALKCLGGDFQGRLLPQNDEELVRLKKMGIQDTSHTLLMEDIVKGKDAFFVATGVTDGELLKGVKYGDPLATTYSIVMCARTGTVRFIEGKHGRGLKQ